MCGRYSLRAPAVELMELFDAAVPEVLVPRYNIAPTQPVLVLRVHGPAGTPGVREFTHMAWGLVPSWADDPRIGSKMINARGETVAEKNSFRRPLRRRRCVVPASGYYEWHTSKGAKQPYFIHGTSESVLPFAGIWEVWNGPNGEELETCAIITTESQGALRKVHNRVPCILELRDLPLWLDHSDDKSEQVLPLLRPAAEERLQWYPVSTLVNLVRNDSAELIEPAPTAGDKPDDRPRDLFGGLID